MSLVSFLALAQAPPSEGGAGGGGLGALVSFLPLILIFLVFWFLIIRPQQKQQKQKQAMIQALKNGDRIVTTGGLFATVKDVHEDKVVAFIADGVKVEIAKHAIGGVVEKKS